MKTRDYMEELNQEYAECNTVIRRAMSADPADGREILDVVQLQAELVRDVIGTLMMREKVK